MGDLVPFPGVRLAEEVTPPASLDARRFARMFQEARALGDLEHLDRLTLTDDQLAAAKRGGSLECALCAADVVPFGGMWFNETTGVLHNYSCRPNHGARWGTED